MKQALAQIRVRPYVAWLAVGVVAWFGLAAGAAMQARSAGAALWPTVVTWDEWVVAIAVLPRMILFIIGILQAGDVKERWGQSLIALINLLAASALVILALDLVVRAVFGLGWKPF